MGHFAVYVVSPAFAGLPRVQRHRVIYDALGDLMKSDIHALKIEALTPGETHKSLAE
jgi:BolA protein